MTGGLNIFQIREAISGNHKVHNQNIPGKLNYKGKLYKSTRNSLIRLSPPHGKISKTGSSSVAIISSFVDCLKLNYDN